MQNQIIDTVKKINYWSNKPDKSGYQRESYINKILSYRGSNLLKVLIGQRRCGKSTILKQTILRLIQEGVPAINILYLNFELYGLQFINNHNVLAGVVDIYFSELKPQGKVYLLFEG